MRKRRRKKGQFTQTELMCIQGDSETFRGRAGYFTIKENGKYTVGQTQGPSGRIGNPAYGIACLIQNALNYDPKHASGEVTVKHPDGTIKGYINPVTRKFRKA